MDKASVLEKITQSFADYEAVLDQVPEHRKLDPGVSGIFSVKDIIWHITWFEREMVNVFRDHALIGSDLWNLPTDDRNMVIYEQNREKPLADILGEARCVHQELIEILENLDEESLNDPTKFREMPLDWVPWQVLAGNTFEHYVHHTQDIQHWLVSSR